MNVYVFWRIHSIPAFARFLPTPLFVAVGALLWGSYIVARLLAAVGAKWPAELLEIVGATWIGIVFLLLLCMVVVDVVTVGGFVFSSQAPTLRLTAVIIALVLAVVASIQAFRAPVVTEYEVVMPGLPEKNDGTVLVLASDMHLGKMIGKKWAAERITQIKTLNPDIVVLGGDIFEGDKASYRDWVPTLRQLSAPLGVWVVTGNHEYYAGVNHTLALFKESGFHVLRDQSQEAAPGLIIAGVDDLTVRRRMSGDGRQFIRTALTGRPNGATVLISHTPWYADEASANGVGLMLSGHTHNGQIWPFTYLVRTVHPLIWGKYRVGNTNAIVCRGTGTWGPRMRLWQRGEIVKVVLRAEPTAQAVNQP